MYLRCVIVLCVLIVNAAAAAAQTGHEGHVMPQAPAPQGHEGHQVPMPDVFAPREASGSAWVPDATPMFGSHQQLGPWSLMLHGNAFAQFLYEGGEEHRTSHQAGSINWFMAMARREVAGGRLGLRGMVSLEPWTIPGCGYPDLLATGEVCDGDSIHDRQHPHDLFMELAVEYDRPLTGGVRWQVYGGPAGEPALGPAGFPHRLSAMPNPIAPIGHHWLDATHITFGVVTGAVYGQRWKVEASAFNGREPDERRWDLDLAALDSYSGRVSFLPTPSLALQVSAGHLTENEAPHGVGPRQDVDRATASLTYHRTAGERWWATTMGWGVNDEPVSGATHSGLLETALTPNGHDTFYGRLEVTAKPAHSLHVHENNDNYTVGKLQAGYTRYFATRGALQPGVGGFFNLSLLPEFLGPRYGGRAVPGIGVYVTLRPAAHGM